MPAAAPGPLVFAHRGASAELPEHTLAAYLRALQDGADGLECDVRMTRDGHLVCVHDRRLDRTSNGRGRVSRHTLAELTALDFGSWHRSTTSTLTDRSGRELSTGTAGPNLRLTGPDRQVPHPPASDPAARQPAARQPAARQPAAGDPASPGPAAPQPASPDPAALEPAALDPAALEPAALEPAALDPAARDPAILDRTRLLTLGRLLDAVRDAGREVRLLVETKHPSRYGPAIERRLVTLLRRYGLAEPVPGDPVTVTVMSFSPLAVRRIRLLAPALPTVLLLEVLPPGVRLNRLPFGAQIAGPGMGLIRTRPGLLPALRAAGHPAYAWTVNSRADLEIVLAGGVAGVITDRPRMVLDHLGR